MSKSEEPEKQKQQEQPAHELLSRLFQTILNEAERNPRFAEDMLKSLPEGAMTQLELQKASPQKDQPITPPKKVGIAKAASAKASTFAATPYNPITLYREFGEDLMRVKLQKLTIANLNALIRHFQLRKKLKLKGKTHTKQDLITALITFAAEYDRQRKGAAG